MKRLSVGKAFLIVGIVLSIVGIVTGLVNLVALIGVNEVLKELALENGVDVVANSKNFIDIVINADEIIEAADSLGVGGTLNELNGEMLSLFYACIKVGEIFLIVVLVICVVTLILNIISKTKVNNAKCHKDLVVPGVISIVSGALNTLFPLVAGILFLTIKDQDFEIKE